MRLVHRNLRHTGYIILEQKDGKIKIAPAFTNDLLTEAKFTAKGYKLRGLYGTSLIMMEKLEEIKGFYRKHSIYPQDLTEELRTGFRSGNGLTQTYPRYYYK